MNFDGQTFNSQVGLRSEDPFLRHPPVLRYGPRRPLRAPAMRHPHWLRHYRRLTADAAATLVAEWRRPRWRLGKAEPLGPDAYVSVEWRTPCW